MTQQKYEYAFIEMGRRDPLTRMAIKILWFKASTQLSPFDGASLAVAIQEWKRFEDLANQTTVHISPAYIFVSEMVRKFHWVRTVVKFESDPEIIAAMRIHGIVP